MAHAFCEPAFAQIPPDLSGAARAVAATSARVPISPVHAAQHGHAAASAWAERLPACACQCLRGPLGAAATDAPISCAGSPSGSGCSRLGAGRAGRAGRHLPSRRMSSAQRQAWRLAARRGVLWAQAAGGMACALAQLGLMGCNSSLSNAAKRSCPDCGGEYRWAPRAARMQQSRVLLQLFHPNLASQLRHAEAAVGSA